jgi:hypothetical protein
MSVKKLVHQTEKPETLQADAFYKVYEEHAKILRAWLVGYGVGVPVIVVNNAAALAKLSKLDVIISVSFFLAGVALQVLSSLINKYIMWSCYYGKINPRFQRTRRYQICSFLSEQFWVDILLDVGSVGLFAYATVIVLIQFVKN